jgi:hypothetical protein
MNNTKITTLRAKKGEMWRSFLCMRKIDVPGVPGSSSEIIAVVPFFNTGEFFPEEEISNA